MYSNYNKPRIVPPSQTVGRGNVHIDQESPVVLTGCVGDVHECPECGKVYSSKIGLGVHISAKHRVLANEMIQVADKKVRWTSEETRLMALTEATAMGEGVVNMNLFLSGQCLGRSFDAIKSKRRNAGYRALVQDALVRIQNAQAEYEIPIVEDAPTAAYSDLGRARCDDDDESNAAGGNGGRNVPERSAQAAAEIAVRQLSTVTGHGVHTLLMAAKRLVDTGDSPIDAITTWFRVYIKDSGASGMAATNGRKSKPEMRHSWATAEGAGDPKAGR